MGLSHVCCALFFTNLHRVVHSKERRQSFEHNLMSVHDISLVLSTKQKQCQDDSIES
jgi:hypothetical protein